MTFKKDYVIGSSSAVLSLLITNVLMIYGFQFSELLFVPFAFIVVFILLNKKRQAVYFLVFFSLAVYQLFLLGTTSFAIVAFYISKIQYSAYILAFIYLVFVLLAYNIFSPIFAKLRMSLRA